MKICRFTNFSSPCFEYYNKSVRKKNKYIAIILVCNVNRCCLFNTMIKLSKEKLIAKCSAFSANVCSYLIWWLCFSPAVWRIVFISFMRRTSINKLSLKMKTGIVCWDLSEGTLVGIYQFWCHRFWNYGLAWWRRIVLLYLRLCSCILDYH